LSIYAFALAYVRAREKAFVFVADVSFVV